MVLGGIPADGSGIVIPIGWGPGGGPVGPWGPAQMLVLGLAINQLASGIQSSVTRELLVSAAQQLIEQGSREGSSSSEE